MSEQHPLDEERPGGLDRARARVEFRLDPKIKAVSEELDALSLELAKLSGDSLPKILQVKVGKKEYTSVCRRESSGIARREISNENPYFHIIDYKIRANLVGEGAVGALLIPETLSAVAIGKDLVEFLESQESDMERQTGWGTTLPVSLEKGRPFKLNEWKYERPDIVTVKCVDGKLYSQFGRRRIPIFTLEKGRRIAIARRVVPDEEGTITLLRNSYWWTTEEINAQRELDEKFATFYVLVEGKSEQEKQVGSGSVKKLEPRFSEVTG
jgi:hypothetical protein